MDVQSGDWFPTDPERVIEAGEFIAICIGYPLNKHHTVRRQRKGGWTAKAFTDVVCGLVRALYAEHNPPHSHSAYINGNTPPIYQLALKGAERSQDGLWNVRIEVMDPSALAAGQSH